MVKILPSIARGLTAHGSKRGDSEMWRRMWTGQGGEVGKRLDLLLLMWLMWIRLLKSWEKARGLGLRGCVLGCSSAHTCRRREALALL
jgi:hypothetical protein